MTSRPYFAFVLAIMLLMAFGNAAPSDVDITGTFKTSGTTRIDATGIGTFTSGTTVNGIGICLSDGTNCPESSGGVGNKSGWQNTTVLVWLNNNATNVSVGYVGSQPVLYVDTARGRVGVNTSTPVRTLEIDGSTNITGNLYLSGALLIDSTMNGSRNTGNVSGNGTAEYVPLWSTDRILSTSIFVQSGTLLTLTGSMNASGSAGASGNLTYANPTTANSTKQVFLDSNGVVRAERYWNGTDLVINVSG